MQMGAGGISGAAYKTKILARLYRRANGFGRDRSLLHVTIPGNRAVRMTHIDRVPFIAVETTAVIRVAFALVDDHPGRRGYNRYIAGGHLVPGKRPEEVVHALMVIAA